MLQQHLSDKVDHWAALRYLAEASKYAEGAVLAETFAAIVAPYFHQVRGSQRRQHTRKSFPGAATLNSLPTYIRVKVIETQRDGVAV